MIKSDAITFKVIIRLRATGLNIVTGTEVPDLTYLIGSPAIYLTVPEYFIEPTIADINDIHALGANTPSFVTLDGDPTDNPLIKIVTSDVNNTGIYSINVIYTDIFSGLQAIDTFVVTVSCVQTIS